MKPALTNPCVLLPWDTDFFGFRIARAGGSTLQQESARAVLDWCAQEKIRCLYFSADGANAETLATAAWAGFKFVDVRLEFTIKSASPSSTTGYSDPIRTARAEDLGFLQALARQSHRDTRFFKDDGFSVDRAADMYAEWIRRDIQNHQVWVVSDSANTGRLCGYISCQLDRATQTGRIGLIAIAPVLQGKGLGRRLIDTALAWCAKHDCLTVHAATQASNVAAQRLYQSSGFRSTGTSVWFHRWFPAAAPTP